MESIYNGQLSSSARVDNFQVNGMSYRPISSYENHSSVNCQHENHSNSQCNNHNSMQPFHNNSSSSVETATYKVPSPSNDSNINAEHLTSSYCIQQIKQLTEKQIADQNNLFQEIVSTSAQITGHDLFTDKIVSLCNKILAQSLNSNKSVINYCQKLNDLTLETKKEFPPCEEIKENSAISNKGQKVKKIVRIKKEKKGSKTKEELINNTYKRRSSLRISVKKKKSCKPLRKLRKRTPARKTIVQEESNEEAFDDHETDDDLYLPDKDPEFCDVPVSFAQSDEPDDNSGTDSENQVDSLSHDNEDETAESTTKSAKKPEVVDTRPHPCTLCSKRFRFAGSLARHLQDHDHNISQENNCPVCKKKYGRLSDLSNHINNVHKTYKQAYNCDICQKSFHFQKSLKAHRISVHHKLEYQCLDCHRRFATQDELTQHSKLHPSDGTFGCSVCGVVFPCRKTLIKHEKTHMPEKTYKCDWCGLSFKSSSTLVGHVRTHTGERPYICELCGNAYAQMSTLKVHQLTHSNTKPHACDRCDYAFRTRAELNNHILVHTKEKKFQCDECGKRFPRVRSLKDHLLTHAGIKPYSCSQCGRRFSCHQHLRRHQRIHKGEMPYTCEICGKQSRQKYNMTVHMRTHNGEKPFVCDICGKSFTYNKSLQTHKVSCGKSLVTPGMFAFPPQQPPPSLAQQQQQQYVNMGMNVHVAR
ncbi:hypothetical protein SNE40_016743 [Patella caerulea]|uniref:C2H2-type domain-containing protein n=1 Tax=Patella caerulea TaxID=87958 RepID=A0AAN8JEW3_PATCE